MVGTALSTCLQKENHYSIMAIDIFDQLSESPVPPPPQDFEALVHKRLNNRLLSGHLVDLALRGLPYAMFQFGRAFAGLAMFTIYGRYDNKRRRR